MPSIQSNTMIPIPTIKKTGDLDAVAHDWMNAADTLDRGVKVGHIDVSEEMAMKSMVLEHRYEGGTKEYSVPMHWDTGSEYITWAFAARTARTMQEKILPKKAQALINGSVSGDAFWDSVGRTAVSVMQGVMRNVSYPGNAPSTIQQKGFDNPLVETGEMMRSVTYRIVDNPDEDVEDITKSIDSVPPAF